MYDRDVEFSQRYQLKKVEGTDDIFDLIPAPGTVNNEGTLINKAALLKDMTAALFGLTTDAVPDDVFAFLGKYNQHWWSRRKEGPAEVGSATSVDISKTTTSSSNVYTTVSYSDSVSLSGDSVVLSGSVKTINIGYNLVDGGTVQRNVLNGKYFMLKSTGSGSSTTLVAGQVYLGKSDLSIFYVGTASNSGVRINCVKVQKGYLNPEYVQSSDRSAYPDSGEQGGYEYQYLGVPFENSVTAPKIETGSYIGTGTYGRSNPNSLTFGFKPKLVFVHSNNSIAYGRFDCYSLEETYSEYAYLHNLNGELEANSTFVAKLVNNTLSWYYGGSSSGTLQQMNYDGRVYSYLAIG